MKSLRDTRDKHRKENNNNCKENNNKENNPEETKVPPPVKRTINKLTYTSAVYTQIFHALFKNSHIKE